MTTLIFTVCDCEKIRGLGHEVSSTCEELSLNPSLFHSPSFSCSTLNGCSSSCLAHSTTPNLALPSSSNALSRQQRRKKGDECLKNENDIKKKGKTFAVKLKGATSEWTASCRNVSPSHWRTSEMSSSLSHTPCWGLFCIRWSSDLHPLPELKKKAYINDLPSQNFKIKTGKVKYKRLPSPLQCWRAHPLHTPHALQTPPSHGPFCRDKGTQSFTGRNTYQASDESHLLTIPTFAGPLGFGW